MYTATHRMGITQTHEKNRISGETAMNDQLDFQLPEFVRMAWVSSVARERWLPRFQHIMAAWARIEWLSVLAGVRSCALTMVTSEEFVSRGAEWAGHGLNVLPVAMEGATNLSYRASSAPLEPGQPFLFRMVLGTPENVMRFKTAWDAGDHEAMGALLGYPACCTAFFHDVWVAQRLVDTTWPMAAATITATADAHCCKVQGPPEANILWRWMGLRAVPHLPCRFDCAPTVSLGEQLLAVGRDAGFTDEMDWLLEVLNWPVEWSALHGIAEIKTPVLKVSTRTDATAGKYMVQRLGSGHPPEGGQGLTFPYRVQQRSAVTSSRAYRAGLAHVDREAESPAWYATDNGFGSVAAMDAAHAPVAQLALATLAGCGGNVLDLGCGNGALLRKIHAGVLAITPFGVELEETRSAHARELWPEYADHFIGGNLFAAEALWPADRRYALAILMPGRLLEASPAEATRLREHIQQQCDHLLVYAYDDWLERYGGLAELSATAGLRVEEIDSTARVALASVI